MWQLCLLLLYLKVLSTNGESSVHILAENSEQLVTSSTMEWVPSTGKDTAILKYAVVAAYQSVDEPKSPEVEGEIIEDVTGPNIVNKPVYICRAKINSVWVSGQLRPKKHACVVSLYKIVSEYRQFEILVNLEGSARLSWVHKDRYSFLSQGAVTSGENAVGLQPFVARRAANSHNLEGSLTHNIGKFTPSENLGVFHLVDQNNNELTFDDGEILVETEPIRYELKSIRFDNVRGRYPKKTKILGQTTLKNEVDGLQRVEAVIGYKYNYSLNWGKGHGLLTGLPVYITLPDNSKIQSKWALPLKEEKSDVAPIEKYLEEGTAVNVTLMGNYTEAEVPYRATVVLIYEDGEKREIKISDTKRETTMKDVVFSFSPIYFLHNNSHVPTTTTSTTTTSVTTSSTTSRITSTTNHQEATSDVIVPKENKESQSVYTNNNDRIQVIEHNTKHDASSLKKKNDTEDPNGATSSNVISLVTVLIISLVVRRVT